jgi:hypothetical protein
MLDSKQKKLKKNQNKKILGLKMTTKKNFTRLANNIGKNF